nr:MAG TPA: hypothetical protein [Caudoviricetes sp.]
MKAGSLFYENCTGATPEKGERHAHNEIFRS